MGIASELVLKRSETIETRATELMEDFNNLKFEQEAEINTMTKKHKEAITKETKLKEEAEKNIEMKEAEIKKQRSFYGDKMKIVRKQLEDAEKARTDTIRDLAVSENTKRELK